MGGASVNGQQDIVYRNRKWKLARLLLWQAFAGAAIVYASTGTASVLRPDYLPADLWLPLVRFLGVTWAGFALSIAAGYGLVNVGEKMGLSWLNGGGGPTGTDEP